MNPKILYSGTGNKSGDLVAVEEKGEHVIAIAADAAFGGGTLTISVKDLNSGVTLAIDATKYEFTAVFEPFKLYLAPGMAVQATMAGSTAADVDGVYMYN